MSLLGATMLVAGNTIGTGLFLLPADLATVGSISILGWVVATVGAMALGLVFAKLGELQPALGGPYAYARDFFGSYLGFQTNYIYWLANWVGNVAIAVAVTGYLSELLPPLQHQPLSALSTIGVIWLLTLANIVGPRFIGRLETWTMGLALVPICGIAILGWFYFDPKLFAEGWNVSGRSDMGAVSRSASIALWAYMGLESASVSATNIENPRRNVPIATLAGLGIAAVAYVACSTVIMGILSNAELQKSPAPFAAAAGIAFGKAGIVVVALCAILKSSGALGGWMLLVGESAQAASRDGMFPSLFGKTNANGVPVRGLVLVSLLMTLVVILTMSPTIAHQFDAIIDLAVVLVVIPYLYSSVAVWHVCHDHNVPEATLRRYVAIGLVASAYCLWALWGSAPGTGRNALIVVCASVPLYPIFIRSMKAAERRKGITAP